MYGPDSFSMDDLRECRGSAEYILGDNLWSEALRALARKAMVDINVEIARRCFAATCGNVEQKERNG